MAIGVLGLRSLRRAHIRGGSGVLGPREVGVATVSRTVEGWLPLFFGLRRVQREGEGKGGKETGKSVRVELTRGARGLSAKVPQDRRWL